MELYHWSTQLAHACGISESYKDAVPIEISLSRKFSKEFEYMPSKNKRLKQKRGDINSKEFIKTNYPLILTPNAFYETIQW